jgi:hypothetical protein
VAIWLSSRVTVLLASVRCLFRPDATTSIVALDNMIAPLTDNQGESPLCILYYGLSDLWDQLEVHVQSYIDTWKVLVCFDPI